MKKTFKTNNGEDIQTGNVEVQTTETPVSKNSSSTRTASPSYEKPIRGKSGIIVNEQPTSKNERKFESPKGSASTSSRGFDPVYEKSKREKSSSTKADSSTNEYLSDSSLLSTVEMMGNQNFIISTTTGAGTNAITFAQRLVDPITNTYKSSDEMSANSRLSQTYEQLTGISQDRPEIVMVTNFQPLYTTPSSTDNDKRKFDYNSSRPSLTSAGRFFDAQTFIRKIKSHNGKKLFSINKNSSNDIRDKIKTKSDNFKNSIENLMSLSDYLLNLSQTTDRLKKQLDIRDLIHDVVPSDVLKKHLTQYSPIRSEQLLKYLTDSLNTGFLSKYDVSYVMGMFGFDENNVKHEYTSTKIWMQLMLEMKNVLSTHSLSLFDVTSPQHKNDKNASKILKTPEIKRFQYTSQISQNIANLEQLKNFKRDEVDSYVTSIVSAYDSIYENVHFRNEEMRTAALINMISREYRYSRGLGNKDVQRTLQAYYEHSVSTSGNSNIIDVIIGNVGDNIGDAISNKQNSLVSVSLKQPESNITTLPLESTYIEGDADNLVPGSSYYVDTMLLTNGEEFNVSRLESLSTSLFNAEMSFNYVVNGLNLLSSEYVDDNSYATSEFSTKINNSRTLFDEIRKIFVGENGLPTQLLQRDVMTSVFAMAQKDAKIRAMLFMYIVSIAEKTTSFLNITTRISSDVFKNAQSFSSLIVASDAIYKQGSSTGADERIVSTLSNKSYFISRGQLNDALIRRSELIVAVGELFAKIISAFRSNDVAIEGSRTRYNNTVDTLLMSTVFDAITSIISEYGNKRIVGLHTKDGDENLIVSDRTDNHTSSIIEIDSRLNKEIVLTQHSVFVALNTLQKLRNSINNVVNYANSSSSLSDLRRVSLLFENNLHILHMLFNEHQIRLFANSIADITSALRPNNQGSGYSISNENGDDNIDDDDELKVLDDAVVTQVVKDALEQAFSSSEFSSESASGYKLFTVGIPLGFMKRFLQKVDVKKLKSTSAFVRQNDVIKVKVYKSDIQNPEIIYKSKDFLFEMSRYPVRSAEFIKPPTSKSGGLIDVIKRFPTRDYSDIFVEGGSIIQYFKATGTDTSALAGSDYSFLNDQQKEELYKNHVLSYLYEIYLKVMTGITTNDSHFDIVIPQSYTDIDFVKDIVANDISHHASSKRTKEMSASPESKQGIMFREQRRNPNKNISDNGSTQQNNRNVRANSAGTSGNSSTNALLQYDEVSQVKSISSLATQTIEQSLIEMSTSDIPVIKHKLGVINETSRMLTPQSDSLAVSKRMIMPKQFDRVFNVLVDPFSFEINVDMTNRTPHGKQALELLIKKGDILPVTSPTQSYGGINTSSKKYMLRQRSSSEGELVFEKYFIAIESAGEDEE